LLIDAIRYGEDPAVKARMTQAVEQAVDRDHLEELLEERALTHESMDATRVRAIREDMERAEARRLQPHFIASFFREAFPLLGGSVREREPKRYEITHVPSSIRQRDRIIGIGLPVLPKYERITFEKDLISVAGRPLAEFICPGHPLLDATIDLLLERYRDMLRRGAMLVDPDDASQDLRALVYLEHSIQDARTDQHGNRRIVSRQMQFAEIDHNGNVTSAGYAPYLDYRPLEADEEQVAAPLRDTAWLVDGFEDQVTAFAVAELVPRHFDEVRQRKEALVDKTTAAVKDRLTKEITYWDHRALDLRAQEEAGRTPRLNSANARQRADELEARLRRRMEELEQERKLSPLPPVAIGGALIVPAGLLAKLKGEPTPAPEQQVLETARIEQLAMQAVMEAEKVLGFEPRDVSTQKLGYDVESRDLASGHLRFIEVKGRDTRGRTVTVTKNEVLTALNKPDDFYLVVVRVDGDQISDPVYIRRPFQREPDFGVTSMNYDLAELLGRADVVAPTEVIPA
jgi:hypothetical protein